MKIYFARHGTTNYNDLKLNNADPLVDVHITSIGIDQAKLLADGLKNVKIERIYVSELRRTQQTAEIVNRFHDVQVEIAPLLNDHRSGFEGRPFMELRQALDASDDMWTARFNDGESINDMKKRVKMFLDEIKDKPYSAVLVVTSQWIVQAAVAILKNISNEAAWELNVQQGKYIELEV